MAKRSKVELFEEIRRASSGTESPSIRDLSRRFGVHRRMVRLALGSAVPPARKVTARSCPSLGPWKVTIDGWLTEDEKVPKKQRHTARRIFERLAEEHGAEVGDPGAEVAIGYRIKERLRDFYATSDPTEARQLLEELQGHCLKRAMPPEIQRLGRTIRQWFDKLCNYHLARVSNGPTEALNNLIKRIKRVGFGFRNFNNYRIRVLLYAGKPNWRVLGSIVVE